jgi:hypothetical protein
LRNLADFRAHIELHRARVLRLGLILGQAKFPEMNLSHLESFLKLHDHSKIISSPGDLQELGYRHERPPFERLFDFYGQTTKTETQNFELLSVISDINSIDDQIGRKFLKMLNLDVSGLLAMYKIEKVADLVDRSLDPLAKEEFGHHMILASEYLQDPHMSALSVWLEGHYDDITQDLSFLSYRKAE